MNRARLVVGGALVLLSAGCGGQADVSAPLSSPTPTSTASPTPTGSPTPTPTGTPGPTVGSYVSSTGCTTSVVRPLAAQLVSELACLVPGAISSIPASSQISDTGVFDFLQTAPGQSLPQVVAVRPGVTLPITSALRTLPQQYLLYAWYQAGKCGISLAATPGSSNHEGGLALDTPDYTSWQSALQSQSWVWFGTGDPVHYTFTGSGTVSLTGKSVLAFQKLWNLNNPADPIAEDSTWGPQTESRLAASPAAGFAVPNGCGNPTPIFAGLVEETVPERCAL